MLQLKYSINKSYQNKPSKTMKNIKIILLVAIFFPLNTIALISQNQNLSIDKKRIHITVNNDNIITKTTQTITNNSSSQQIIQILEPLSQNTKNIKLYKNSDSFIYEIQTNKQRLETIWNKAKEEQNHNFFRLADPNYPKLLVSTSIIIPANSTITTKLTTTTTSDYITDFFFTEIWLHRKKIKNFELIISLPRAIDIQHFFPIFDKNGSYRKSKDQISFMVTAKDFIPQINFRFFWSNNTQPSLIYPTFSAQYKAFFPPVKNLTKNLENLIILIDTSGSMYGNRWQRIKEILSEILPKINLETNIQVIFFDNKLIPFNTEFLKNNFEFQETLFASLHNKVPTGKSDFYNVWQEFLLLWKNNQKLDINNSAILLLSDGPDIDKLSDQTSLTYLPPLVIFDFSIENNMKILSLTSGGIYQSLFSSPPLFIEKNEYWQKWSNLTKKINHEVISSENFQEILPHYFLPEDNSLSTFFVGRNFNQDTISYSSATSFLPQIWAKRQIIINLQKKEWKKSDLNALLSLSYSFGITTKFFQQNTSPKELLNNLTQASASQISKEILKLQNKNPIISLQPKRIKFINHLPFYPTVLDKDESILWNHNKNNNLPTIQITPFSEAQKNLWMNFSEIFSKVWSIGLQVNFCNKWRCVTTKKQTRDKSLKSDLFLWGLDHSKYQEPISRGKFIKLIFQIFPEKLKIPEDKITPQLIFPHFTDIPQIHPLFNESKLLAEKNIISGFDDGSFRSDQFISRGQALKILLSIDPSHQEIKSEQHKKIPFSDIQGWVFDWVNLAYSKGWIQGYDDLSFRPHENLLLIDAWKLLLKIENNK